MSAHGPQPLSAVQDAREEETPDELVGWQLPLLELLLAVTRHLRLVVALTALGLLIAVKNVIEIVPFYTATSVNLVLPREKASFDASIETSSLESSEGKSRPGSALPFTLPANVDLFVMLMKSRGTLERIATQFFDRLVETEDMPRDHRSVEQAAFVRDMVKISGTEDGMISVEVTSVDPQLAADIANAFTAASDIDSSAIESQILSRQANILTESARAAKKVLDDVQREYAEFSERHSLLDPTLEIAEVIESKSALINEIGGIQKEIDTALLSFREDTPEIQSLRRRMAEVRKRHQTLLEGVVKGVGAEDVGRLMLQHRDLEQRLSFRQDLHLLLSSQADIYQIQADQAHGPVVTVRPATAPVAPAGPSKKKTAIIPVFLFAFLGVGLAITIEQLKQVGESRALMDKVDEIKGNLVRVIPFVSDKRKSA